jgi:DNA-binding FrmR family transcriptional regulator
VTETQDPHAGSGSIAARNEQGADLPAVGGNAGHHTSYGYGPQKQALLGRLRRIEGQVRGVHRMVESDTYCIDVLTQIAAASKALQAVAVGLLEGHLAHCVVEAGRAGDPTEKVKEATDAIARLLRS